MRTTFLARFLRCWPVVLLGGLLLSPLLSGCGKEDSPYPRARVTTPVGKPGACAHCNKKINTVEKKNLLTVDGIQHIVCDEKCAAGLKKSLAEQ